jgi:hypothetical protein
MVATALFAQTTHLKGPLSSLITSVSPFLRSESTIVGLISSRRRCEEVPPVPGDVEKHGDTTAPFLARLRDELHAGLAHPVVGRLEVVDAQEQPDATRELVADGPHLPLAVRAGEQERGRGAGRSHDHPALRTSVVGQGRRVLHELEAENVNEESNCLVVVVDDEGDLLDVHAEQTTTTTGRSLTEESVDLD